MRVRILVLRMGWTAFFMAGMIIGIAPIASGIVLTAENVPVNASFEDHGNGSGLFTFAPDTTQAGFYQILFSAYEGNSSDGGMLDITVNDLIQNNDSTIVILDSLLPQQITEGETLHVVITAHIETVYVDTTEPEPDTGEVHSMSVYGMQSEDDGQQSISGYVNTSFNYIELRSDLARWGGALRFPNIQIPQGSEIVSAHVSVLNYVYTFRHAKDSIACQDVANALPLNSSVVNDVSDRWKQRTDAVLFWEEDIRGAIGIRDSTPDLRAIVQEIIDRPDWQEGNAMLFILKCVMGSYLEIYSWDLPDHIYGPILEVKYK